MIVTFAGHGQVIMSSDLKVILIETIEECIKEGCDTFYCGGYGSFDSECAYAVKTLKVKYPNIQSFLILPYLNEVSTKRGKYYIRSKLYDDTIYPELETVPLRFAISKRNEWMVNESDLVIAFVRYDWGGAWNTLQYAKQKNKRIINLADLQDI